MNTYIYKAGLSTNEIKEFCGDQQIAKLSSNENPFGPSLLAITAAGNELTNANIYPPRNDNSLKAALAQFHGNGLSSDNFFSANGGVEVISLIEDALIKKNERAIVTPPCFGAYISSLTQKGVKIDKAPLLDGTFDVDVDAILNAITKTTRLVYLCNPNNPTGTYFGDSVLDAILNGLPDHVTLIYDEVYYQFATRFNLPDAQKHVRDGRNIVIIHSFSKAYGLAGMRIGYGIAPSDLVKKIELKKRSFHINAGSMSAAIAALKDEDHLKKTVDNNTTEVPKITAAIHKMGLTVSPTQANLIMFKCPKGKTAEKITASLLSHGVMVRPAFFLPDHVRVSVGKPDENQKFLIALAKLV